MGTATRLFITATIAVTALTRAAAVTGSRNYVAVITPAVGLAAEPGLSSSGRVAVRYVDGIGRPAAEVLVGEGGAPGAGGYPGDIATVTEHDGADRAFRQ